MLVSRRVYRLGCTRYLTSLETYPSDRIARRTEHFDFPTAQQSRDDRNGRIGNDPHLATSIRPARRATIFWRTDPENTMLDILNRTGIHLNPRRCGLSALKANALQVLAASSYLFQAEKA